MKFILYLCSRVVFIKARLSARVLKFLPLPALAHAPVTVTLTIDCSRRPRPMTHGREYEATAADDIFSPPSLPRISAPVSLRRSIRVHVRYADAIARALKTQSRSSALCRRSCYASRPEIRPVHWWRNSYPRQEPIP